MSGFVLAPSTADAERELRTFAEEVAPLVRDAVSAARAGASHAVPADAPLDSADSMAFADDDGQDRQQAPEHIDLWSADPLSESSRPRAPKQQLTGSHPGSTGTRLVLIHDNLRQEMRQIREAVAQVAAGQQDPAAARSMINSLTLRQNYWTLGRSAPPTPVPSPPTTPSRTSSCSPSSARNRNHWDLW